MNKATPKTLPKQWTAFRLGHLGDVVLTTGVLARLGETRGWTFAVVTREPWASVFTNHPFVTRVISPRDSELTTAGFAAFCRNTARQCEGWGFLDLHGSLRSRMMGLVWRGPVLRYLKMSVQRRLFLSSGGRICGAGLRAVNVPQRYALAVEASLPPPEFLLPKIWLTAGERDAAREQLHSLFPGAGLPVALHPYATHSLKAWPDTHWKALTARLDAVGIPWIILGKGAPLFPGNSRDLTGATTLRETCALLASSRTLVTGDSGPMHLGTAVGTPVIALFGPTTREWGFFPSGERDIVLESALPCRPCSLHGKKPCPRSGECLASITPESVLRIIEETTPKV